VQPRQVRLFARKSERRHVMKKAYEAPKLEKQQQIQEVTGQIQFSRFIT